MDLKKELEDRGFIEVGTGGNCKAMRWASGDIEILIADELDTQFEQGSTIHTVIGDQQYEHDTFEHHLSFIDKLLQYYSGE